MQRLKERRLSLLRRDYLVYRGLWPATERAVARAMAGQPIGAQTVVVDLGCGERPYADLFAGSFCIGVDCGTDGASPDVVADAMALPLADGCADLVFSAQVLEHVRHPERLVAEAARILKPGGALVLSAPFWWPLHEEPHDYHRFTHHGLAHLLRHSGLDIVSVESDSGALTQLAVALIELLPRWALVLVPVINGLTPWLQRLSHDRRSTLNHVAVGRRPAGPVAG